LIDHYDWAGGREAMLRFGPDTGPVVVAALPLLEEANRTRALVVTILRLLAERGIAGALPDLPGTGDSLVPTEMLALADLQEAFAAVVRHLDRPAFALGIRSGAIIDAAAPVRGRWHLAPVEGAGLLRELNRLKQAGDGEDFGGNRLSLRFLTELDGGLVVEGRTVRLESDAGLAELKMPGSPLWRRAEPDNDAALAARLAEDIAQWLRACES
jgi:hypothetical protein